jgi:DNA polymerase elongation subunit (family B)
VPFDQYSKTTKVLDGAFISELSKDRIILPDVDRDIVGSSYPGGFVKEPDIGYHKWILSFDATSLYPSIMMNWNISPETKYGVLNKNFIHNVVLGLGNNAYEEGLLFTFQGKMKNKTTQEVISYIIQKELKDVNKEDGGIHGLFNSEIVAEITKALTDKSYNNLETYLNDDLTDVEGVVKLIREKKLCISGNGVLYTQDKVGIIPKFVKVWFDRRKEYKKKMIDADKKGDKEKKKYYDLLQLNYKILINSVYGYLGTTYSRFYDFDNAVSVTINGQNIIQKASHSIEHFFENDWDKHYIGSKLKAKNFKGVVTYNDTDSVYLNCGKILDNVGINIYKYSTEQIKNFIIFGKPFNNTDVYDEVTEKGKKILKLKDQYKNLEESAHSIQNVIQKIITESMITLTTKEYSCIDNKIFFKREAVAAAAGFIAPKMYVAWVLNNEGVECNKMKATGVEIVRSSTPLFIQDILEDIVFGMLKENDKEKTDQKVREVYKKFINSPVEVIAFPRGVHNLDDYEEGGEKEETANRIIHVRASLLYNKLISANDVLKNKYELIKNDSKLKFIYMKQCASFPYNVLAFVNKWPTELGLDNNVDKDFQFEKTFLKPVTKFYKLFGWKVPSYNNEDASDLFI